MYQYLLVILEEGAVPFCYYHNPQFNSTAKPVFMPKKILEKVIRHARKNGLYLNFIFGKHRLPPKHEGLLESIDHVKMVPLELKDVYPDGVLVLEADDSDVFGALQDDLRRNVILRVDKNGLPRLAGMFESLRGKFKRLNLHLTGVENFSPGEMTEYEVQLGKMAKILESCYREGEEVEVNVLSDRLLLKQMNNCDAGLKHLTVAPNGRCYICPGFYHDDEASAVSAFDDGDMAPLNRQLLDIRCAPICARCDAFHCKRCVWLNRQTTLEVNVPSEQQCVVSHIERDVSRQMLNVLKAVKPFDRLTPIPRQVHRDPFDVVVRSRWEQPASETMRPEQPDPDHYLAEIYEMQLKILRKLEG